MAERPGRAGVGGRLWVPLIAVLGVHLLIGLLQFDLRPYVVDDATVYQVLARAIGSGEGYADIHVVGSPPHVEHAPLYPTMLAALLAAGGGVVAFKALSLGSTFVAVVLLTLLAASRLPRSAAIGAAAAFAVNPLLIEASHRVAATAPFLAFALATVWMTEPPARTALRAGLALAALVLAVLSIEAGIVLVAALLLYHGPRREWRRFATVAAASVSTIGVWWLWKATREPARITGGVDAATLVPGAEVSLFVGPADLLVRVVNNLRLLAVEALPRALSGDPRIPAIGAIALLVSLVLLTAGAVGLGRALRAPRPMEWLAVSLAGFVLLDPKSGPGSWAVLPLVPLLLLYAMSALVEAARATGVGWGAWSTAAAGGALALLALPSHVERTGLVQGCLRLYAAGDRFACYQPERRSLLQAAAWVAENTPNRARVLSPDPPVLYLVSGRRSPVGGEPGDAWSPSVDQWVDYVVVIPASGAGEGGTSAISVSADRFEPIHRIGEPPAYVLRRRAPRR